MAVEHMVWIRFKDGVSAERKREHVEALRSLKNRVPGVRHLAVGENFTDRSGGFTHGLLVAVDSREALQTYLDHPEHVAVARPLREDAELRALDIESER